MVYADFTITPSPQVVGVEQQAVFRCHHPSTTFISWKVNETITVLEGVSGPPGITAGRTLDGSGNVIDFTLTIVAQSNYNETQVKCIATFSGNQNPNEETRSISLSIQGKDKILLYYLTCMVEYQELSKPSIARVL